MSLIDEKIKDNDLENALKRLVHFDTGETYSIQWGMHYMFFAASKRIRPLLTIEANRCYKVPDEDAYVLAAATELIHTYSLVHDDLPCMDNADLRRGIATLHKLQSEAYAVLVGDALLTEALTMLGRYSKTNKLPALLKLYGQTAGCTGMILGQKLDLDGEKRKLSYEEAEMMEKCKTARLIQLSLISGGINGDADEAQLTILSELGDTMGLIFQLQDDLLDIIGSEEKLGKKVGSDAQNNKSSAALMLGVDKTKVRILEESQKCLSLIEKLPANRDFFKQFIDYLIRRDK